MPKLRIEGTPDEVEAVAALLRRTVDVREESQNYPNRPPSLLVRRYVTVWIDDHAPRSRANADRREFEGFQARVREEQERMRRKRHESADDDMPDPFGGHVGQWLDVDGEPVHLLADPKMSEETRGALIEVVRAMRRKAADDETEGEGE